MGGSSTGVSVRTVWLSALCIIFTVWVDEQAFISKFAVRKNSEGKEIESKAHTWSKIPKLLLHIKARISQKARGGAGLGHILVLSQAGHVVQCTSCAPCTQLPFLQTLPPCSEQLNHLTLRAVWSQTPWCKPGHVNLSVQHRVAKAM